jgi:hypothetical protein
VASPQRVAADNGLKINTGHGPQPATWAQLDRALTSPSPCRSGEYRSCTFRRGENSQRVRENSVHGAESRPLLAVISTQNLNRR